METRRHGDIKGTNERTEPNLDGWGVKMKFTFEDLPEIVNHQKQRQEMRDLVNKAFKLHENCLVLGKCPSRFAVQTLNIT